jgi:UDP-glucose 4-epimerase
MLAKTRQETLVYDNLSRGHREFLRWGTFVEADLGDPEALNRCFRTNPIEAVLHLGAFIEVGESVRNPSVFYRNNVANTLNLLDAMVRHGVGRIIFSSSCAIYEPSLQPMSEETPVRPSSPYGQTKWMIEAILSDYAQAYGLCYVNLRYFNAAGADPEGDIGEWHEPETHLVPIVLQVAAGLRPHVEIYGTDYDTPDGTCLRDFVHVTDLAAAHTLALDYLRYGGGPGAFNLANARGYSVREVIEASERITGRPIRVMEKPRRAGDADRLVGDAGKARSMLGWVPKIPDLEDIIRTAWDWHRQRGRLAPDK